MTKENERESFLGTADLRLRSRLCVSSTIFSVGVQIRKNKQTRPYSSAPPPQEDTHGSLHLLSFILKIPRPRNQTPGVLITASG